MSQIANVVINDGAATPVAHTFYPQSIVDGAVANWRENLPAIPVIGQGKLQVAVRELKSGVMQVHVSVSTPALESVGPANSAGYTAAPKVAYEPLVGATFNFDKRTTTQQRKDIRSLLMNALANAIVIDAVDNLNPPF